MRPIQVACSFKATPRVVMGCESPRRSTKPPCIVSGIICITHGGSYHSCQDWIAINRATAKFGKAAQLARPNWDQRISQGWNARRASQRPPKSEPGEVHFDVEETQQEPRYAATPLHLWEHWGPACLPRMESRCSIHWIQKSTILRMDGCHYYNNSILLSWLPTMITNHHRTNHHRTNHYNQSIRTKH